MVGSVTEIPERNSTTKQTIINPDQRYFTKISPLQQRHTLCRLFWWRDTTKELGIRSIFSSQSPLAIHNNTTVLPTIVTDPTVPATSYYYVTVQRVGKIRKQSMCIPIKIGTSHVNLN